jgi:PAS domain S-box-containing protein
LLARKLRQRNATSTAVAPAPSPGDQLSRQFEHERRLKENSDRHFAIADAAADAIVVFNRFGHIQSFNRAAERLFGYSAAEVIGNNVKFLIPEPDPAEPGGDRAARRETGQREVAEIGREVVGKRKDGSLAPLEASIAEWRDVDGRQYFIGVVRDVSLRRQQTRDLQSASEAAERARIEAESASRAKTEFLATMSHEIRTPLTSISGFVDLLTRTGKLTRHQRRYVELVRTANAALMTIVNDILDFSKVEAGQLELEPRAFSPTSLVHDTAAIVQVIATAKNLLLQYSIDRDVPEWLMGDQARLRQVLLNLLNNAVKFTETGSVSVDVCKETASDGREMIRFSVIDTGAGIAAEHQHRLFKTFSQADSSVSRRHGGTGLGLAICKRLVEMMGGEIGVVSEIDKGTNMWFTACLPRASMPTQEPEVEFARQERGAESARILIVDDVDTNREIAEAYLQDCGYSVDTVSSGAEAIQMLGGKPYDLVLMDIQMPVMDGTAATKRIRAMPTPIRDVPIIAMTGAVLPQQVRRFLEAGMNDHVGKPIERAKLYNNVRRWLPKSPSQKARAVPSPPNFDWTKFDEFVDLIGAVRAERIASRFLDDLTKAFGPDCGLGEAQRTAHALVNCAGVLGFESLVAACRAVEAAPADDSDLQRAAISEVRREQAAARETILDCQLPKLRELALGRIGDEARPTAAAR